MSLNTSHTPDGHGVLIYNGEVILLYTSNVKLKFSQYNEPAFKGGKSGSLYLTSHRIIFMSNGKDDLKSFAMPFHCLRDVKLEQPLLAPNYLKGCAQPLPGGNFDGCPSWRLSFPKGGCIEFGQALLRAAEMASRSRPFAAPPVYGSNISTEKTYYAAPSNYYMSQGGNYQGFQAPTHAFPEQPPAGNVYMYESPPPYAGIGQTAPHPVNNLQSAGTVPYPDNAPAPGFVTPSAPQPGFNNVPPYPGQSSSQPPAYSAYQEAPPLPTKNATPG